MEKFIPYEKLSKKQKRLMDAKKRISWGEINPVSRKTENAKIYNRKKAKHDRKNYPSSFLSLKAI